jgi:AcrR family transcriptional regulator
MKAQRKRRGAQPVAPVAKARDRERTRGEILAAARVSFATRGYGQSGVREIAAAAGITPALVVRYFGSKEKLFVAAIEGDLGLAPFVAGERAQVGRTIVAHLINKPRKEADSLAILLLAATEPSLTPLLRRLIQERLFAPLVAWLGGRNAAGRAALLLSLVGGVWIFRQLLPLAPLTGKMDRATAAALAATIQGVVDAPAG